MPQAGRCWCPGAFQEMTPEGRAMALCIEMTQPLANTWRPWIAGPAVGTEFGASTAQVLLSNSHQQTCFQVVVTYQQEEDKQYRSYTKTISIMVTTTSTLPVLFSTSIHSIALLDGKSIMTAPAVRAVIDASQVRKTYTSDCWHCSCHHCCRCCFRYCCCCC